MTAKERGDQLLFFMANRLKATKLFCCEMVNMDFVEECKDKSNTSIRKLLEIYENEKLINVAV